MELNDAQAIQNMGGHYSNGSLGLLRDHAKAFELFHRAAELGFSRAYYNIGHACHIGNGVEIDEKKAIHYYELAATGGSINARHNLGVFEWQAGNIDRASKHWMISVKDGYLDSLVNIKQLYKHGHIAKDDYAKALRSYQVYLEEIKSDQRDQAVANWGSKYYESSVCK